MIKKVNTIIRKNSLEVKSNVDYPKRHMSHFTHEPSEIVIFFGLKIRFFAHINALI